MEESRKNDIQDDKLRWDLLPLDLIEKVVEVYHFGAKKYAPNSWQNLPDGENRYRAALLRHLTAHQKGELKDPESGLLHLQHVCWNALAMLHFALKSKPDIKAEFNAGTGLLKFKGLTKEQAEEFKKTIYYGTIPTP